MSNINEQNNLFGYDYERDIVIPATEETINRLKDAVFPDEYVIDNAYITDIKLQYTLNCWAFASTAMMETYLIKNGFVSKEKSEESTFSETHMTYAIFDIRGSSTTAINPNGRTPVKDKMGKELSLLGSRIDAASYMARNLNSVLNIDDPDYLTVRGSMLCTRDNKITFKKYNRFQVDSLYFIENPVVVGDENYIQTIKLCLMNHGSVSLGFFYMEEFMKQISNDPKYKNTMSYYMNRKSTYSDVKAGGFGHMVAIVGWDDNFDNFNKTPSNKGAFKVKNSSGTGGKYGDGYIWVSYDDANLKGSFCIIKMQDTKPNMPSSVYTHSAFGMMRFYPEQLGLAQSVFSDTFKIEDDDESITAVGLCNITPCLATVKLLSGSQSVTLLDKEYLSYPGFHRIEVAEQALGAKDTEFTIEVTYDSVGMSTTYIPLEYKYDIGYDNLDLSKVSGSIKVNDTMMKITDYNKDLKIKDHETKFGNLPIYISVKGGSRTAQNISLAYDNLKLPALTADGLLNRLPPRITPSAASASVSIEWRLEPYNRQSYDKSYKPKIMTYQMDYDYGMINTSDSAQDANITAIIGTGKYALKKRFQITLPPRKPNYSFTMGSVTEGYKIDLSGTLSNVEGATVNIECNNVSESVQTDKDGNWHISSFRLYDPTKNGGWQKEYANSTINVTITDDNKFELMRGQKTVTLTRPFAVDEDNKTVIIGACAGFAALALIGAVAYAIYHHYKRVEYNGQEYFPLDDILGTIMGESIFGDAGGLTVNLGGATVKTSFTLFETVGTIEEVTLELVRDFTALNSAVPDKFAGLAMKMEKGGSIKNCKVNVKIEGVKSFGGLFFEGEDVTVENCSVKLTDSCADDFGGIAHTLTGKSSLKNVQIAMKNVSGANVAGVAVNLTGNVSNSRIALSSVATKSIGGVCCNANDVMISDILAINNNTISISSESSCVAGIAAKMTGKSLIEHCLVTGKIDGSESGTAYGIAPGLPNNALAVTQCVCVPAFITGKNAYRISLEASSGCIAYDGIVNLVGSSFISSGEILKNSAELLSKDIFVTSGFDMDNVWSFDNKKCIPSLKALKAESYGYPFPCPYPTISGKYQFAPNAELALYGAANEHATKMAWRNLSPKDASEVVAESNYMLNKDEFYLQMHLTVTEEGEYTMDVISVLDDHTFSNNITIEIVAN